MQIYYALGFLNDESKPTIHKTKKSLVMFFGKNEKLKGSERVKNMLGKRLKSARLRANLTQEQLGVLVGIDEGSASARMNQYEKEKHAPDFRLSLKMADVLNIPVSYLYTPEEKLANIILLVHSLDSCDQELLLNNLLNGKVKHGKN